MNGDLYDFSVWPRLYDGVKYQMYEESEQTAMLITYPEGGVWLHPYVQLQVSAKPGTLPDKYFRPYYDMHGYQGERWQ